MAADDSILEEPAGGSVFLVGVPGGSQGWVMGRGKSQVFPRGIKGRAQGAPRLAGRFPPALVLSLWVSILFLPLRTELTLAVQPRLKRSSWPSLMLFPAIPVGPPTCLTLESCNIVN